jgi:uncharacterized membrane protein YfcA
MFGTGMLIGVISGLVGAGGGFLSVPFLMRRGVRIQNAVATSAALGFLSRYRAHCRISITAGR